MAQNRDHIRRSAEEPERRSSARVAAGPREPAVERVRRIDAYIDYFGSDACGETLLDGGAR